MAYNPPIGFLVTWTCYGTRLHGDERGTRDDDTNARGTRFVPPSFRYENLRRHQMKETSFLMDARHRRVVKEAIIQHASFRQWGLFVVSVRTNHVHVVVEAHAESRETLRQFKAYATRALRKNDLIEGRKRVWTEGGSVRWLFTDRAVDAAVDYVDRLQGAPLPEE